MRAWLLPLVLVMTAGASAARADVLDHAKLFKAETVAEANKIIKEIEAKYHHPVTVETFAEIPASRKAEYDRAKGNNSDRELFYSRWCADEFDQHVRKGLYVLICKSPGHVQIHDGPEGRHESFTQHDAADLKSQLVEAFGGKQFDTGLLAGLEHVRTAMLAHQGIVDAAPIAKAAPAHQQFRPQVEQQGGIMSWLCPILLIVGGFWIVIALIRAFTGAGRSQTGGAGYGGPGYGYGGGGGGFMSNFMGGMFGSMAGNWMYNNFFGGGGSHGLGGFDSPAQGGEPDYGSGSNDAGGDFGSNDAGGDFGGDAGGDFGGDAGGDFGGGDFGGDAGGDF